MARPREFIYVDALQRAMTVFWEKGYHGTSMSDLTSVMGINKSSLYDTFGNKEKLFSESLRLYCISVKSQFEKIAAESPTAYVAIQNIFSAVIKDMICGSLQGCLLGSSLLEQAMLSAEVRDTVEQCVAKILDMFQDVIVQGQQDGSISTDESPEFLAKYLLNVLTGLKSLGRYEQDESVLQKVADKSFLVLKAVRAA